METTHAPNAPADGARRVGAAWIAAAGALLLLAAAAVFVAVQWDTLTPGAKLGIVATLTAACLTGGRWLSRSLPGTGAVVFHLGAFLLPVNAAAIGVHVGAGWREILLVEGMLSMAAFAALGTFARSRVLILAAAAAAVPVAGGVAGLTPLPGPLVLSALAVGALAAGQHRGAIGLAGAAGLAPVMSAVASEVTRGRGVLTELGFLGDGQLVLAVVTGIAAAVVLGIEARRRESVSLAFMAMASGAAGLATTWGSVERGNGVDHIALAGALLIVELAALLLRHEPFWARPTRGVATICEIAAIPGVLVAAFAVLAAPGAGDGGFFDLGVQVASAAALLLGTLAFLAADLRHAAEGSEPLAVRLLVGRGNLPFTVAASLSGAGSIAFAAADGALIGAALVGIAGLLVVSGRRGGHCMAALFVVWAPSCAFQDPWVAFGCVTGGGAVLAWAATLDRRAGRLVGAHVLAGMSGLLLASGAAWLHDAGAGLDAAIIVSAIAGVALAAALDRADRALGLFVRLAVCAPLTVAAMVASELPDRTAAGLLAGLFGILALDAARLDDRHLGAAAGVLLTLTVGHAATAWGLGVGGQARALGVLSIVTVGLAAVVPARWDLVFGGTSILAAGLALLAAGDANDPAVLADVLFLASITIAVAGLLGRYAAVVAAGSGGAVLASMVRMAAAGVTATDVYALPGCAALVAAGAYARHRHSDVSSWAAFAPAVAVAGTLAIAERISGGGGEHAVLAGAIAIVSIGVGGARRLAGPLVTGSALLVALVVHESLGAAAAVPTWMWLAAGGSLLLTLGITLERTDTSPADAGRRVADVLRDRFA
jgi:hypothetical protein